LCFLLISCTTIDKLQGIVKTNWKVEHFKKKIYLRFRMVLSIVLTKKVFKFEFNSAVCFLQINI